MPDNNANRNDMEITEQTLQQVERFIKKIAQKFPPQELNETSVLTDIHVRCSQDSGELLAFNDDEQEITRCVVEQWIDNKDENFYEEVAKCLRNILRKNTAIVDNLGILKPYSFVLEDDDKEHLGELYLADDDTIIVGGDLMEDLDHDLDTFLDDLLKEV
jgi:N-acetyl-anhydromuramyl-L-alanine amidase AmpD